MGELSGSLGQNLHVDPLEGCRPTGTVVYGVDLSVRALETNLRSKAEGYAPLTKEHIFANALVQAVEHGQTNLVRLEQIINDFRQDAMTNPQTWSNQYGAEQLCSLCEAHITKVGEACKRVHKTLMDTPGGDGEAALIAMGQHRLLRNLVVLSERWSTPLNGVYEKTSLALLTGIIAAIKSTIQAVQTPNNVLERCDSRWMLGTVKHDKMAELRQYCTFAGHLDAVACVSDAVSGQMTQLTGLRSQAKQCVAEAQTLITHWQQSQRYVDDLRRKCRSARLPPPEEWVDRGGQQFSLSTVAQFVEIREKELKKARDEHQAELASVRGILKNEHTSAEAQTAHVKELLLSEIAQLRTRETDYISEITRLTQLLIAAKVPFEMDPFTHSGSGSDSGSSTRQLLFRPT